MFEKKKSCRRCGSAVSYRHNFCPNCGENLKERQYKAQDVFGSVFEDVEKEFARIDRNFFEMPRRQQPRVSFRMPGGVSGISVTISSGTGMKPNVNVKTYGEYKKIEPEIRRKLGARGPVQEIAERPARKPMDAIAPSVTEEPATEIKESGTKQTISIRLPGVRSAEDIDIRRLEQSIEVRAVAGDKAYFKLVPIKGRSVENKGFRDGVLTLEVGK